MSLVLGQWLLSLKKKLTNHRLERQERQFPENNGNGVDKKTLTIFKAYRFLMELADD
jgi:hypothetical protein